MKTPVLSSFYLAKNKSQRTKGRRARKNGGRGSRRRSPAGMAGGVESIGGSSSAPGLFINQVMSRRTEQKWWLTDMVANFASVSTTPSTRDAVAYIVCGNDYNNRIGRTIHLNSLEFSGQLCGGQANSVTDENRNVFRLSVIECISGLTWSSGSYNVSTVLDPRIFGGIMRVLYDEVFTLVSPGRDTTGYLPAVVAVHRKVRLNKTVNFSLSTAVAPFPYTILIVACSDSGAVPHPGFTAGSAVTRYTDA